MKGHRTDEEDEDEGGTEWTGKTAMKGTERTGEKGKGSLYIAQYPVRWPLKAPYTFCPPWQTCSFRHQLDFSGKHSSHAAITRND